MFTARMQFTRSYFNLEGYILILLGLWWWAVKSFPRPIFELQKSTATPCQDSILSIFQSIRNQAGRNPPNQSSIKPGAGFYQSSQVWGLKLACLIVSNSDSNLINLKLHYNNQIKWGKLYAEVSKDGQVIELTWKDAQVVLFMSTVGDGELV